MTEEAGRQARHVAVGVADCAVATRIPRICPMALLLFASFLPSCEATFLPSLLAYLL